LSTNRTSRLFDRFGQGILLVLVGFALVLVVLLGLDRQIIQPAFRELASTQALEDSDRALADLHHELSALAEVANDWAYWDDAYAFAHNRNQAFVRSNYSDASTLSAVSGIDLLAYYDQNGRRLLEGVYHPVLGRSVSLQLLLGETPPILTLTAPVMQQAIGMEGWLATEHGLLLLVARPILTSSQQGPARGIMLIGRFFKETDLAELAKRTKVAVNLLPRSMLAPAEQALFDQLSSPSMQGRKVLEGGFVYQLLVDMGKEPLLLLRTAARTEIAMLGRRTGRILSVLLGAVSLVLLIGLAAYRHHVRASKSALEESESRYRLLFESESDAIFLVENQSGRILEANQAAALLYGYNRNELLTMRSADLWAAPEDAPQGSSAAPLADDQIIDVPLAFHRKKDGAVFPVEITGRFFIHKEQSVHLAAVRDVTTRKHMEAQLRFTQFAVDSSADAAFWVSPEGRFLSVNREGCRSLGYAKEELLGMTIADVDPEFPFETWPQYWRELQAEGSKLRESVHKTKDGRTFPVEIRANFVNFNGQKFNFAIVRDISKRKQMEQERLQMEALKGQLEKEKSLGVMAGAVAHHFNNQLMIVEGFVQMAMEDQDDAENHRGDLALALKAASKASQLSKLMLTYLGQPTAGRRPMDLAEVCRQSLPILEALLPSGVELRTDLPVSGPIVLLSVEHIQQILTNLTTNSIEAVAEDSGWIALRVATVASGDIPLMHRFPVDWQPLDQTYACLNVTDNGDGIAPENIEKLFDPFFTNKFTGRGLGLPVVLGLTKALDGAITVASKPGQGSVLQVFLPIAEGFCAPQSGGGSEA